MTPASALSSLAAALLQHETDTRTLGYPRRLMLCDQDAVRAVIEGNGHVRPHGVEEAERLRAEQAGGSYSANKSRVEKTEDATRMAGRDLQAASAAVLPSVSGTSAGVSEENGTAFVPAPTRPIDTSTPPRPQDVSGSDYAEDDWDSLLAPNHVA